MIVVAATLDPHSFPLALNPLLGGLPLKRCILAGQGVSICYLRGCEGCMSRRMPGDRPEVHVSGRTEVYVSNRTEVCVAENP